MINDNTSIIEGIQLNLKSLARIVMDERITQNPRFLLIGQCQICAITDTICYVYTNTLGQMERSVKKLKEKAALVSKVTLMICGIRVASRVWMTREHD